jgi:hypothetical protein
MTFEEYLLTTQHVDLTNDAPRLNVGDRVEWGDHAHSGWGIGVIEEIISPDIERPFAIVNVEQHNSVLPMRERESIYTEFLNHAPPQPPAPRRRTEPAITVTLGRIDPDAWLSAIICEASPEFIPSRTFTVSAIEAFSPSEVEQCKQHGAAAYESMAADIAQVRELARAAWVRSLPVWQPDETCGDYARRAGILPPKPGRREQWEDSVWLAAAERMAMEVQDG